MANMKALASALVLAVLTPGISAVFFDCKGSFLCGKTVHRNDCDTAWRMIVPGNQYNTYGSKGSTGVCWKNCGLFVQGKLCSMYGSEMIQAFKELRAHDCQVCGSKVFDNGCSFTIDYISGC